MSFFLPSYFHSTSAHAHTNTHTPAPRAPSSFIRSRSSRNYRRAAVLYTTFVLLEAYSSSARRSGSGSVSWGLVGAAATPTSNSGTTGNTSPHTQTCFNHPTHTPASTSSSTSNNHRRFVSSMNGHGTNNENTPTADSGTSSTQPHKLPSPEALRRPLIISGPSGVGKGTLIRRLLGDFPTRFGFSCSHTTRGPRPGEEEGIDYFYTTKETILAEIAAGKFLEHATVHGNLYGTSFDAVRSVQDAGKICVLDIDVQGVISVKEAASKGKIRELKPLYVFIAPPSLQILEERLRGRETEKEEDVIRRLGNARKEVEYGLAKGNFDKIVVNGVLEEAYADLKGYIELIYYSS